MKKTKEVKLRPRIAEHDLLVKIKTARRLLAKSRVKVSVIFRGREMTHTDLGLKLLDRVIEGTKDMARVESRSNKGNIYSMILVKDDRETLLTASVRT